MICLHPDFRYRSQASAISEHGPEGRCVSSLSDTSAVFHEDVTEPGDSPELNGVPRTVAANVHYPNTSTPSVPAQPLVDVDDTQDITEDSREDSRAPLFQIAGESTDPDTPPPQSRRSPDTTEDTASEPDLLSVQVNPEGVQARHRTADPQGPTPAPRDSHHYVNIERPK